jgi:hypothetical protein
VKAEISIHGFRSLSFSSSLLPGLPTDTDSGHQPSCELSIESVEGIEESEILFIDQNVNCDVN